MEAPFQQLYFIDDARCEEHVAPGPHPECPDRLRAIRSGLVETLRQGGACGLSAREARSEELLRVHTPEHLAALERALARGAGFLDEDTFFSLGSRRATWLAAGGAAELASALLQHERAAGVLTVRPPGHHATRERAMGFCLVNNVAVAAEAALAQGLSRVAIVDWDVHHGNGTQAIFEADPRVLFVSLHQWPLYPGTGRSQEIGVGAGRGFTINLPLPAGSAAATYAAALHQVVLPALRQFRPELTLVSAGFDAHRDDPLGGMQLGDSDFGALTSELIDTCSGVGCTRVGLVLEGGYDLNALERSGCEVARALLGGQSTLERGVVGIGAQRAIDDTRRALGSTWQL